MKRTMKTNCMYHGMVKFTLMLAFIIHLTWMDVNAQSLSMPDFRETIHSPQVTLIKQYGDYPVDISNGLVDISIPLSDVHTTKLNFPLSLKFHHSGLRHDERESFLGIRWTLGGLGQISCSVKGYPDDYHYNYPQHDGINNPNYRPDFFTLYGTTSTMYKSEGKSYNSIFINTMGGKYRDTEYDIYSYTLPSGKSGKFFITDINNTKTVNLMPYEAINVQIGREGATIVDDDGTTYQFEKVDWDENGFTTAWHLTKIVSADKQDVITISYVHSNLYTTVKSGNLLMSYSLHDNTVYAYYDAGGTPYGSSLYNLFSPIFENRDVYFDTNGYNEQLLGDEYVIGSIEAKSGEKVVSKMDFEYTAIQSYSNRYLQKIMVKNAEGFIVKQINFTLKNNLSGKFKLLDKVEFKLGSSNEKQVYVLDYYDSMYAPYCKDLSNNFDWWGYYSAGAGVFYAQDITLKIPTRNASDDGQYTTLQLKGGNKRPDENSAKIGMVKSITYPTGGKTEFIYEQNKTASSNVGGLRIKEIKNIVAPNKIESKYYEYKNAVIPDYLLSPGGQKNLITFENEIEGYYQPSQKTSSYQVGDFNVGSGRYIRSINFRNLPLAYTQYQQNIISYKNVTEYFGSSATNNTGKVEYVYQIGSLKTDYYKNINGEVFTAPYSEYNHLYISPEDFWKRTNLSSKAIYKKMASGEYKEVEKYDYTYETFKEKSVYDMPVYRYRYHQIEILSGGYNEDQIEIDLIYPDKTLSKDIFAYVNQKYTTGAVRLVKEIKNTYYDNGNQTSIKEFEYDANYLLLTNVKITNSDASVYSTKYEYSFNNGGSPYVEMKKANMLNIVTQKRIEKDEVFLERIIYNYNDITKLGSVYYDKKDAASKDVIHYYSHDLNSLPREVVRNKGEYVVYIRNITGDLVAEILNARYSVVVSALGGSAVVDRMSQSVVVTSSDMTLLNNLRQALPDAHVYTYTYKHLVGMLTATDPMGLTVYYTYDNLGRLKEKYIITNNKKEVLESYDYNYLNQ